MIAGGNEQDSRDGKHPISDAIKDKRTITLVGGYRESGKGDDHRFKL